ncbi:hypothetical protein Acor_55370 [Acrocarpospora corrugata]|uniref:Uncharacterized protein n=1 Tax=Acrocarpospora corrugata TaxID=35763 RepID=A0A5M3W8P6_9ACTN|nr:hypothetical protein [Acrocarpospora corrugata]GES03471.1 hypothetical protein Acor_55370 [Acrocarpospora corrugata]
MKVLTTGSAVNCTHPPPAVPAGTVTLSSTAKLKVSGKPVLVEPGLGSITGCLKKDPQNDIPCSSIVPPITGKALKLKASGLSVLLAGLKGSTSGVILTVMGTLTAQANQTKLGAR